MPQEPPIMANMSVLDNIAYGIQLPLSQQELYTFSKVRSAVSLYKK